MSRRGQGRCSNLVENMLTQNFDALFEKFRYEGKEEAGPEGYIMKNCRKWSPANQIAWMNMSWSKMWWESKKVYLIIVNSNNYGVGFREEETESCMDLNFSTFEWNVTKIRVQNGLLNRCVLPSQPCSTLEMLRNRWEIFCPYSSWYCCCCCCCVFINSTQPPSPECI